MVVVSTAQPGAAGCCQPSRPSVATETGAAPVAVTRTVTVPPDRTRPLSAPESCPAPSAGENGATPSATTSMVTAGDGVCAWRCLTAADAAPAAPTVAATTNSDGTSTARLRARYDTISSLCV